jgi:hypothetical protein
MRTEPVRPENRAGAAANFDVGAGSQAALRPEAALSRRPARVNIRRQSVVDLRGPPTTRLSPVETDPVPQRQG